MACRTRVAYFKFVDVITRVAAESSQTIRWPPAMGPAGAIAEFNRRAARGEDKRLSHHPSLRTDFPVSINQVFNFRCSRLELM
jgi:hypothetical protein